MGAKDFNPGMLLNAIKGLIGANTDAEAGADLTQEWGLVALLKGILSKLRATIDVELKGGIFYGWRWFKLPS